MNKNTSKCLCLHCAAITGFSKDNKVIPLHRKKCINYLPGNPSVEDIQNERDFGDLEQFYKKVIGDK